MRARRRHGRETRLGRRIALREPIAWVPLVDLGAGLLRDDSPRDLDRLKETNDEHGHDVGDRLIRALAGALARAVEERDALCRIGGDEFAILSAGAEQPARAELLFRARAALVDLVVGGVPVSACVGGAECPPCLTVADAIRLADERLYAEKTGSHWKPPRVSDP